MKERPILFNGDMVRAILNNSKTQTRRAVKFPHNNPLGTWEPEIVGGRGVYLDRAMTIPAPESISMGHSRTGDTVFCPFGQPGDHLWVRETFITGYDLDDDDCPVGEEKVWYRASDPALTWRDRDTDSLINTPWKPSIHMPRKLCRITLEIADIRVERLNEICYRDAVSEGIGFNCAMLDHLNCNHDGEYRRYPFNPEGEPAYSPKESFQSLWQSINGPDSWDANPWVWVVDFKRLSI